MRTFVAASLAAVLIATNAFAMPTSPLPAGQPAGVKNAQMEDNTVWWVVGLGVVAAGIALVASGSSNGSLTSGTLGTSSSSTTTTATTTTK
jgi:hypothetical protein